MNASRVAVVFGSNIRQWYSTAKIVGQAANERVPHSTRSENRTFLMYMIDHLSIKGQYLDE